MVEIKRSTCLFCSLGCGTAFRAKGEEIAAIDYDRDSPVNLGALCSRGNYNFELLNHPRRLTVPMIGNRKTSWEEAIRFSQQQLKEFSADSVGIALSCNASNEDAFLAVKLAEKLGTKNITAAGNPFDLEAYQGSRYETAEAKVSRLDEIQKGDALLIVGDILRRSPVLSWRINQMKYGKRGNKLFVIDPNQGHTSWFATEHLQNRPGSEAMLLLCLIEVIARQKGEGALGIDIDRWSEIIGIPAARIVKAAHDFHAAAAGTIIFSPSLFKERNDLISYFIKILASISTGKKYLTFYGYGNTLGVNTVLDRVMPDHISYNQLQEKSDNGQIQALITLGEEGLLTPPELEKRTRLMKFSLTAICFPAGSVNESDVFLPLATHMEENGTYLMADGRVQGMAPIAPKVGGKSIAEIAAALGGIPLDSGAVKGIIALGAPPVKVDLDEKIAEAGKIVPRSEAPTDDITHFGNNRLAKNFFWYRVNNKV